MEQTNVTEQREQIVEKARTLSDRRREVDKEAKKVDDAVVRLTTILARHFAVKMLETPNSYVSIMFGKKDVTATIGVEQEDYSEAVSKDPEIKKLLDDIQDLDADRKNLDLTNIFHPTAGDTVRYRDGVKKV